MTAVTETLKRPFKKTPARPQGATGYSPQPFTGAIGDGALVSWLAGVGLHHGFGVSVPFIAGWVLVTAFMLLVSSVASHASAAHHKQALKAAPWIAAADLAGETGAQAALDAQGFLDIDKKLREGVK